MTACPFCASPIPALQNSTARDGETGGTWWQARFECGRCTAVLVHDVFEKIGNVRESWRVERVPRKADADATLACPSCAGPLFSAMPAGAAFRFARSPDPAMIARSLREIEHVCLACKAAFTLAEDAVCSWRNATTRAPIASPTFPPED